MLDTQVAKKRKELRSKISKAIKQTEIKIKETEEDQNEDSQKFFVTESISQAINLIALKPSRDPKPKLANKPSSRKFIGSMRSNSVQCSIDFDKMLK